MMRELQDSMRREAALAARLAEQERALEQCRGLLRQHVEAVGSLKARLTEAEWFITNVATDSQLDWSFDGLGKQTLRNWLRTTDSASTGESESHE